MMARRETLVGSLLLLILGLWGPTISRAEAQAVEPLTLRVNDSSGDPDGLVAIVIRTYSPKGVGSGQTCMFPRGPNCRVGGLLVPCRPEGNPGPFAALESYEIFSGLDDVESTVSFDPITQLTDVSFVSESATINDTDGPLAVFYYRLRSDAVFGDKWTFELEASETLLVDANGDPIPVDLRPGDLSIRSPGDPYAFEADGDEVLPGAVAQLAVQTTELFEVDSGDFGFFYDPAVASAPPTVAIDPRYGEAVMTTTETTPGELQVSFQALGAPLNSLPGQLFSISLPTRTSVPPGTISALSLDPASSLRDSIGATWPLVLKEAELVFLLGEVFADGFESGDTKSWSASNP